MKIYAKHGYRGIIIDLDTNLPVHKVIWLDEELGLLEAFSLNQDGTIKKDRENNYITYQARGRFKYIPADIKQGQAQNKQASQKIIESGLQCVRCSSSLVLQGDELCPVCKAKDKDKKIINTDGTRVEFGPEKVDSILSKKKCSYKGCSNIGTYLVSDEVEVSHQKHNSKYYLRGMTVARRYYCEKHYSAPRILDQNGEVITTDENSIRPQ